MKAVVHQAIASEGEERPAIVLDRFVETVRPTGGVGTAGLYPPSGPGAPNEDAAEGLLASAPAGSSRRACTWAPAEPTRTSTTTGCAT